MIIAIFTPLMSRVHQHVWQAAEMTFCDSISSLDRFNSSLFVLESTIQQGLEMVKEVMHSVEQGPGIVMHC